MTDFVATHALAREKIAENGAAVTFTLVTETHDPATGTFSNPQTTTVGGYAMRVRGDPEKFIPGRSLQVDEVMLLFAPTTYGERPELESTVSWEGDTWEVVAVNPLAPNGTDILSRVVIA